MMKRTLLLSVLAASLSAALSSPALAGPGTELTLEQPVPDASGALVLRGQPSIQVRLEGGVGEATGGAFHLRAEGGWIQGGASALGPAGEDLFRSEPFDTTGLPNGAYALEVRVWDEVPAYDPSDPTTYAARTFRVAVDNPAAPPSRILGVASVRAVRLSWTQVPDAERPDFQGYRVWTAAGASCPEDPTVYELLAEVPEPGFASAAVIPGRTCFRVTVSRVSEVTGTIDSAGSAGLNLLIPATARQAAGATGATRAEATAAPVPTLLEGLPEPLGTYEGRLPYGARPAATGPVELAAEGISDGSAAPGGASARSLAMGSILLLGGIQLRVFLRKGRVR